MQQKPPFRHLRAALALGLALSTPLAVGTALADDNESTLNIDAPTQTTGRTMEQPTANVANLDARLQVDEDPRLRAYNEIMYLYDLGDHFGALNLLLVDKASHVFSDDDDASQTLLGDLYTELGLPDQAEAIFSRAITSNTISATRNRTWFDKGRLQYLRGNYRAASKVLSDDQHNLSSEDDYQRRIMLANVMMQEGQASSARHVLDPIPLKSPVGAYATYNMGVAAINSGHTQEGMVDLWRVMNLPVGSGEVNALKDRAALALGYSYLKQRQPGRAHDALVNIRLDGPFSNPALLALGYSHYEQHDYKRALAFWLELCKRKAADSYVEEALLLAPRAYEDLGAKQQALDGYMQASVSYRNQLAELDGLSQLMSQADWLEQLAPENNNTIGNDPLVAVETTTASNKQELIYIYQKLATNQFNEAFKQYEQLRRLDYVMAQRADDLNALRDVARNMLQINGSRYEGAAGSAKTLAVRLAKMQKKWESVQMRAQDLGNNADDFAATASVEDQAREQHLRQMHAALDKLPHNAQTDSLRLRLDRLEGLSTWIIASNAPVSQVDMQVRLGQTGNDMQTLQLRMQALKALLADNRAALDSQAGPRIDQLAQRVVTVRSNLASAEAEYRNYLRKLALNVLEERKTVLSNDLAEAYLNVARLQDQAVAAGKENSNGGGTSNTPGSKP